MKLPKAVIEELTVAPGSAARLATRGTSAVRSDWLGAETGRSRDVAEGALAEFRADLADAQRLLFANQTWALLVILQGLDASGKDGTIAHVMSGVDPQGCSVTSFKVPTSAELAHDFLWRCALALPPRGHIGIFNRSYYEEVVVTRVHPELLEAERLPDQPEPKRLWDARYEDINAYERYLSRNGTAIVKIFLHVSKDEQKKRFLARLDDPAKHWKFSVADIAERRYFDEYSAAYEDALSATSTVWAPWYVVPADRKFAMRALVGGILVEAIDRLGLRVPELPEDERKALKEARRHLLAEG